jgi:4-oxalocrotonate tautomerase
LNGYALTEQFYAKGYNMPLARIDLAVGKSADFRKTIGDIVYNAMVDILKAPKDDLFQVISEHQASDFVFDPHFSVLSALRIASSSS